MRSLFAAVVTVLGLAGCATQSATAPHAQTAPPMTTGTGARTIELPGTPGEGKAREVRKLVESPVLKLASITLRGGTVLPEHHADVPVTIQALVGGGTLVTATERLRLDSTHAVMLDAKVPHSVEPDAGTDLVLLIHHLGAGAEHAE